MLTVPKKIISPSTPTHIPHFETASAQNIGFPLCTTAVVDHTLLANRHVSRDSSVRSDGCKSTPQALEARLGWSVQSFNKDLPLPPRRAPQCDRNPLKNRVFGVHYRAADRQTSVSLIPRSQVCPYSAQNGNTIIERDKPRRSAPQCVPTCMLSSYRQLRTTGCHP